MYGAIAGVAFSVRAGNACCSCGPVCGYLPEPGVTPVTRDDRHVCAALGGANTPDSQPDIRHTPGVNPMKKKLARTAAVAALFVVVAAPAAYAYATMINGTVAAGGWYMKALSLGPNGGTPTTVDVRLTSSAAIYPAPQWHLYLVDQTGRVVAYSRSHVHAAVLGTTCYLYIYNAGGRGSFNAQVVVEYSPTPWGGSS